MLVCGVSKSEKPVRNLSDDKNSLQQEKKIIRKVENQEILRCFKKYRKCRNIIQPKITILTTNKFENPKNRSGIYEMITIA